MDNSQEQADAIVMNAFDTICERIVNDEVREQLRAAEQRYISERQFIVSADMGLLRHWLAEHSEWWPLRVYLADHCLQLGDVPGFEREVGQCLAQSKDSFVVIALFMMMTRLYILRTGDLQLALHYVQETLVKNPDVAPYIRSIYIQLLLEAEDFEAVYEQLNIAVTEKNTLLSLEELEMLPLLLARLGRWVDQAEVTVRILEFTRQQLNEKTRFLFVRNLMADVAEREQLGDLRTARLLLDMARAIDDHHPDVAGYLSIALQMPKGWGPLQ